jgi:predicted O-methyltransferase YrrM
MIEKLKTAAWFAQRPNFWAFAGDLAVRKFRPERDGPEHVRSASDWAAERAVCVAEALKLIGLYDQGQIPILPPTLLKEARNRVEKCAVRMGGAGDINLIFAAVSLSGARRVIETGVALGWSSLAVLAGLKQREEKMLVSVDMPYPKMNSEPFVGLAVPDRLRGNWEIIREPDRHGLEKAIMRMEGTIDLSHYDSDKSWWGRQYAYPLLWRALRPGGIFISDDIQDNMAFAEFVAARKPVFAVTEFEGKYVGIARKL